MHSLAKANQLYYLKIISEFKEKEVEVDDESALHGTPNPFSMPLPAYYPRPGKVETTTNPKVSRMISDMVGNPSDPNWPKWLPNYCGYWRNNCCTKYCSKR